MLIFTSLDRRTHFLTEFQMLSISSWTGNKMSMVGQCSVTYALKIQCPHYASSLGITCLALPQLLLPVLPYLPDCKAYSSVLLHNSNYSNYVHSTLLQHEDCLVTPYSYEVTEILKWKFFPHSTVTVSDNKFLMFQWNAECWKHT